jgi:hypothetical protein
MNKQSSSLLPRKNHLLLRCLNIGSYQLLVVKGPIHMVLPARRKGPRNYTLLYTHGVREPQLLRTKYHII